MDRTDLRVFSPDFLFLIDVSAHLWGLPLTQNSALMSALLKKTQAAGSVFEKSSLCYYFAPLRSVEASLIPWCDRENASHLIS